MYGGVRGRKTRVGEKLHRFPPTRLYHIYTHTRARVHYILLYDYSPYPIAQRPIA